MEQWFLDAKFGIFIHWGIYSLGNTTESWAFFNNQISYEDYMAQAKEFTAENWDPDEWAALFAKAGAKYAVLTSKHHDGFALWPTKLSPLNSVEGAPAGRDLIGPFCDALRRHGLKVGLYFSHLDWSHPDYASIRPKGMQPHDHSKMHGNQFAYAQGDEDYEAWERFLAFHRGQLKEICETYKPDLLWFDGDWERDPEQFRMKELREELKGMLPHVILNSRMGGHGDYGTPEQAIPIAKPNGPWEFCVTMNDNWGYVRKDQNHKSARQCIRMLAECAGMGGNLLLDIGPKNDGSIIPEQSGVLEEMGAWMEAHKAAIHDTVGGLPHGHFYGPSTLSKDGKTLNLIMFDRPVDGVAVKGIRNEIVSAEVLGHGQVSCRKVGGAPWAGLPGVLWIDVPAEAVNPLAAVIRLTFNEPLDLYTGGGDPVTFNN